MIFGSRIEFLLQLLPDQKRFEFNAGISAPMELSNANGDALAARADVRQRYITLLQLLHPFAPHISEELREMTYILMYKYAIADPALVQEDVITIVVQVNGKLRGHVEVANPPAEEQVLSAVRSNDRIQQWVAGKQIVKTIYVPGKLVNVVVR